eukprot:XP_001705620.1 Hypothetical protein GL50803_31546 [Giardia lamblia ATCC 50803]
MPRLSLQVKAVNDLRKYIVVYFPVCLRDVTKKDVDCMLVHLKAQLTQDFIKFLGVDLSSVVYICRSEKYSSGICGVSHLKDVH